MKHNADKFLKEHGAYTGMGLYEISVKNLEDFAKLVEQATLESAAKVCDELRFYSMEGESSARSVRDEDSAHEHCIEKLAYGYAEKKIRALKD